MRGLIIREPWIGMILAGQKSWEMRSKPTSYRGRVGLIRKGTGMVVGIAEIVDSLAPVDRASFQAAHGRHGILADQEAEVLREGWIYPWVLMGVKALMRPVFAGQKPGAVTWVTLSPVTISKLENEYGRSSTLKAREIAR